MKLLSSIVVFVTVFLLINAASMQLEGTKWFKKDGKIAKRLLIEGGGVALAVALVSFLASILEDTWWCLFLYGVMATAFVGLFIWWGNKKTGGTEWKEAISFALLDLMFALVAGGPAGSLANLVDIPVLTGIVRYSNWLAFIAFLGYMGTVLLFYHAERRKKNGESHKKYRISGIIVAAIAGILFLLVLIGAVRTPVAEATPVNTASSTESVGSEKATKTDEERWVSQWATAIFGSAKKAPATERTEDIQAETPTLTEILQQILAEIKKLTSRVEAVEEEVAAVAEVVETTQIEATEEPAPEMWDVFFYHEVVEQNDIEEDDDNFGTSILDQILLEKVQAGEIRMTDIAKEPKELIKLVTTEEYLAKVVERMGKDPALGASWMATWDAYMGSDYLGQFSTELKDHPDARMELINGKVDEWCYDQEGYYATLAAFVGAVEDGDEVYLEYYASGLDDQMFMAGHTVDGIPNVTVMTSLNHSGVVFVVKNRIKNGDTVVTMLFRDDCGGQPTNMAKKLGVTPKANPRASTGGNGGSTGGNGGSTGGKSTGGSTGGKSGNDPKNVKEGITHVNDNPTINNDPFTGSTTGHSTAEISANSEFDKTIRDLTKETDSLTKTNKITRDVGEQNIVTTPTSDGDTVDGNAVAGTGHGGTDTASKVSGEVTGSVQDTGVKNTTSNKAGGAEESWGGPPL
ncbi:sulfite exporter TauE/SafE family protein [Candidatus Saccharibacteria bacterium]|nr:sulfite exporter TauE/SafE family protein [Candidatus Saccharibacteria bacterium]